MHVWEADTGAWFLANSEQQQHVTAACTSEIKSVYSYSCPEKKMLTNNEILLRMRRKSIKVLCEKKQKIFKDVYLQNIEI